MNTPVRQYVHAPLPSREERERIMERRARLMRALIDTLVAQDTDPQQADVQLGTLVVDYGAAEMQSTMTRGFAGAIMSGVLCLGGGRQAR
jgi:hypothetical protein